MIRKFISQVDGAEFQYRFNGINLELKPDGCDWSDFIPEDKRVIMGAATKELAESNIMNGVIKAGDRLPAFSLPNSFDETI